MATRNPQRRKDRDAAASITLARRLWADYLSRYWPKLAISLAAMAVYAASASAIPTGVEMINAAFTGEGRVGGGDLLGAVGLDPGRVVIWGPLLVLFLGGANAGAQYLQSRLAASAALAALRDMQTDVYAKLVGIDDAQLREIGAGQAAARLTTDIMALRETLARASNAARDLLTLIGLLGVMLFYDWALFLIVFLIYPTLGWPVARIGKTLRRRSKEAQDQAGELAALGLEASSGGRLIRAYGLEDEMASKAGRAFDARLDVLRRMAHLRALNEPFIFFVGAAALALIIGVVAIRIAAGALNTSELVAFIIALLLMSQPARGLSTLNAVAQEGFGAFERLLAVIDLAPTVANAPNAVELDVAEGRVVVEGVTFAYGGSETGRGAALNGAALNVAAGETVAIVGESGAGKSTLFNLILRLYDPQAGRLLIDDQDIAGVTMASLRQAIAIVSQETTLFDDTVAANIGFGRRGASREEIVAAARHAAADGFIRALPNAYDERVGEGGLSLSGGQRQRIAIARAFLKDAPILLLDEATSALDAETESQVQAALGRLSRGRTTLIIAHRLATVVGADRILLMADGRIVDAGEHTELAARNDAYRRLADLQFTA